MKKIGKKKILGLALLTSLSIFAGTTLTAANNANKKTTTANNAANDECRPPHKLQKDSNGNFVDENGNVIISEGPGKNWIEPKGSVDHYLNRTLGGSGATNRYPVLGENVTINKVNLTAIKTYGKVLDFLTKNGDGILPYSFVYSSCSTHTGLALNLAGIPTLFIHPYTVQGSVWLWNKSITPSIINNSYHLQNQRK